MYKDLREFIEAVEQLGALRRVDGADPQFEIGAITEVAAGRPGGPALLFNDIQGFPRGFRILTNAVTSAPRAALALGLDPSMRPLDALKAWMEKRKSLRPHAPVTVKRAPFLQNSQAEIDLSKFPAAAHSYMARIVVVVDEDVDWLRGAERAETCRQRDECIRRVANGNRRHPPVIALTLKPSRRPPRHNQRRLRVRPTFQRE